MAPVPLIEIQRATSHQSDVHNPLPYARAVDSYAKVTHEQSLDPGQSFEALVQFLKHILHRHFLRPEIMHQDPFYALSELFSVLSYAESQILDMIEGGLARDSWQAIQDDDLQENVRSREATHHAQNNLVHARQMLETRISNISSVLEFTERHQRLSPAKSYPSWPHCTDMRQQRESDAATKALQLDFAHLHRRATTLYSRCESAMTLAMDRAGRAEARRSIHQVVSCRGSPHWRLCLCRPLPRRVASG